jgi:hypothetical protein
MHSVMLREWLSPITSTRFAVDLTGQGCVLGVVSGLPGSDSVNVVMLRIYSCSYTISERGCRLLGNQTLESVLMVACLLLDWAGVPRNNSQVRFRKCAREVVVRSR